MAAETIDHGTLSALVEAGAVKNAHIVGQSGGWAVLVKYGATEHPLTTQRSRQMRLFRKFETLVAYLKEIGIAQFNVDAANYDPATASTNRRPDRTEALKRAHEAAAYDTWFREQVQASIDDPRPSLSDEEVRARFASRKTALQQPLNLTTNSRPRLNWLGNDQPSTKQGACTAHEKSWCAPTMS